MHTVYNTNTYLAALCGAGVSDADCAAAVGIFSPVGSGHTDAIGTGMADQVPFTIKRPSVF